MPKGPADDIKAAVNNLAWKSPLGQINNTLLSVGGKIQETYRKGKKKAGMAEALAKGYVKRLTKS